jgi:hypothetical protein
MMLDFSIRKILHIYEREEVIQSLGFDYPWERLGIMGWLYLLQCYKRHGFWLWFI